MRWSWHSGGRGSLLSPAGSITAASLWLWGQLTRRTRRFLKSEGERETGLQLGFAIPPSPLQSCDQKVKMFRASLPNVLKHIKTIFRLTKTNLIRIQHAGIFLIIFCALMHSASLHQLHYRHTDAATVSWQKRPCALSPSLYETNSLQRFYFLLFNPLALFRPSLSWHLMTECMCDIWMCSFQRRFY